jgi:serpin B
VLLLAACRSAPTHPKHVDTLPRALTSTEREIISGSNDFAISLFRELQRQQPDSDLFMSPLSASMALGMAMNGAAGATLDAMRGTLGFGTLPLDQIGVSYRTLIDLLRGLDRSVDFRIGNSIWYRRGFTVERPFLDAGQRHFDARIAELDFDDPKAPGIINGWVKESTNGKIETIVDRISPDDVMYLINAIYFKGVWQYQFDKARTSTQPFFAIDGSTTQAPLMWQKGTFPATSTADYDAVELPYGGGAYAMVVVVPKPGKELGQLVASLDASRWASLLSSFTERSGDVYLPRFRLEWKKMLNDPLTTLGMGIAFQDGKADFSGISRGGGLFISSVLQKSYVDVYEEGTEAAAATSVGISLTSASPALLRADRPFLFAIRERLSGTVLFMGTKVR